jgi:DNA replication and repair protein RecF
VKLKKLFIQNIRNIDELILDCESGVHYIHGQNAQGKTSILESIYLLSNLRSFRDPDTATLLKSGTHQGKVLGQFEIIPGMVAELKVELEQGQNRFEKRAYINQKLAKSAISYFEIKNNSSPLQFHAITLNPTSTDLVRQDPAFRRNYLNQVISSQDSQYMDLLKRYNKTIDQKNALLKQEYGLDEALLGILNEKLGQDGAQIVHKRLVYLDKIAPRLSAYLEQFAPDQAIVEIGYFSKCFEGQFKAEEDAQMMYFNGQFGIPSVNLLTELHHQQQARFMVTERYRRSCLLGPHRDDFVLKMNSNHSIQKSSKRNLVEVGSQGEVRSVLLGLKLAELDEFQTATGVQPVLLIDDFSSELDRTRRGFLLEYLKDSILQIFVTSTEKLETSGRLFRIGAGKIQIES